MGVREETVVRSRAIYPRPPAVHDHAPLVGAGDSRRNVGVKVFLARLAGGAAIARVVVGKEGAIECGAQYGHEDGHDANVDLALGGGWVQGRGEGGVSLPRMNGLPAWGHPPTLTYRIAVTKDDGEPSIRLLQVERSQPISTAGPNVVDNMHGHLNERGGKDGGQR